MDTKMVLVTGALRGIGRACCLRLVRDGYKVVINYRGENGEKADELRAEIERDGGSASLIKFDIADRDECRTALESYTESHGAFWGIVLNAGICRDNVFVAMDDSDWDDVIHTNLDGFYNVLKPVLMPMCKKRKGRIVVLSSVSGVMGNRGQVNYSASKAGLIGAVKALALELASRNITVNAVAPGVIETDMIQGLPVDEIKNMIPMKRLGKPDDIAAAVSFLISENAGYITRQVLSVNGGL